MSAAAHSAAHPVRELLSEMTLTAFLSLCVLIAFIIVALCAPLLAPHGEAEILTNESFAYADETMLLGSDFLGRDIVSRLIYGARVTLSVALAISILAFLLGSALGFFAAVKRGWIDALLSRLVDALISFPAIMIALIVVTALGSSFTVLIITVALIDATRVFRIARALGMDIVVQDYIEAAKVRGEGLTWIMWHELLPNALGPLAAEFGIRFTYATNGQHLTAGAKGQAPGAAGIRAKGVNDFATVGIPHFDAAVGCIAAGGDVTAVSTINCTEQTRCMPCQHK